MELIPLDKFSEYLRTFRAKHQLSQTDVGKLIGVGIAAVSNWEHDRTVLSAENYLKLLKVFENYELKYAEDLAKKDFVPPVDMSYKELLESILRDLNLEGWHKSDLFTILDCLSFVINENRKESTVALPIEEKELVKDWSNRIYEMACDVTAIEREIWEEIQRVKKLENS